MGIPGRTVIFPGYVVKYRDCPGKFGTDDHLMLEVTRSMACVSVSLCVLVTRVSYAKTAELIEMLFGG